MITALRAALLCKSTSKTDDDVISLEGLYTSHFTYAQNPAYLRASLYMHMDLDGRSGPASLRLKAPHFLHRVPMTTPLQVLNTVAVLQFVLPIVEPGELIVVLMDEGPRGKAYTTKWGLGFTPDAKRAEQSAEDVIRLCNEETARLLGAVSGRAPQRH